MENLYFIAITPPEAVSQKIIKIQEDIAQRFQSKASLKVMPHITLKAPFRFTADMHETVVEWFSKLTVPTIYFNIELKNFDAFHNKNKPVLFINPVPNLSLISLQKYIIDFFKYGFPGVPMMNLELDYKPHLTVAFRDLQPDLFEKAWEEFKEKEFSETFEISDYHLLQHQGKGWQIIQTNRLPTEL